MTNKSNSPWELYLPRMLANYTFTVRRLERGGYLCYVTHGIRSIETTASDDAATALNQALENTITYLSVSYQEKCKTSEDE